MTSLDLCNTLLRLLEKNYQESKANDQTLGERKSHLIDLLFDNK